MSLPSASTRHSSSSSDDSLSRQSPAAATAEHATTTEPLDLLLSDAASTSSMSGSSDNSDENICDAISFLQAKQSLLQRASMMMQEDDAYCAANAAHDAALTTTSNSSSKNDIYQQARDYLTSLLSPEDTPADLLEEPPPPAATRNRKRRQCCNPSHPAIDASLCTRLAAVDYVDATVLSSQEEIQFLTTLPSSVFGQGQWMARALLWGEPCQRSVIDCSWQKFYDPYSCSGGLVPPNLVSMKHAVDLQDAMTITNEPRLLTQATPPFCVVHVNRAFLLLAGVGDCNKPYSMVGRPVETFFQVTQVAGPPEDKQQNYLESILALEENDTRLTCRIKVIPVMDRYKRQRRRLRQLSTTSRLSYSCMSHVLIQVQHVSEQVNEPCTGLATAKSSTPLVLRRMSFDSGSSTEGMSEGPGKIVSAVG